MKKGEIEKDFSLEQKSFNRMSQTRNYQEKEDSRALRFQTSQDDESDLSPSFHFPFNNPDPHSTHFLDAQQFKTAFEDAQTKNASAKGGLSESDAPPTEGGVTEETPAPAAEEKKEEEPKKDEEEKKDEEKKE